MWNTAEFNREPSIVQHPSVRCGKDASSRIFGHANLVYYAVQILCTVGETGRQCCDIMSSDAIQFWVLAQTVHLLVVHFFFPRCVSCIRRVFNRKIRNELGERHCMHSTLLVSHDVNAFDSLPLSFPLLLSHPFFRGLLVRGDGVWRLPSLTPSNTLYRGL